MHPWSPGGGCWSFLFWWLTFAPLNGSSAGLNIIFLACLPLWQAVTEDDRSRGLLAGHDLNLSSIHVHQRTSDRRKKVTGLLLALARSALRYAMAALCWLLFAWSTTLLVRWLDVPWIHMLKKFFCPLIQASNFRQGSHNSTEMRLLSLGSLSHCNQLRLSIWHLSFSDWLESKLELPIALTRFRPTILTGSCHMQQAISCACLENGRWLTVILSPVFIVQS